MQSIFEILQQLSRIHEQQKRLITSALREDPLGFSFRQFQEYARGGQRLNELERELTLAVEQNGQKAG
ncbi:MAG: hypothetical protein NVS1B11_35850 [Terriglobales bacterium]